MQWTKSGECPHDGLTMAEFWHLTWMTVLLCTKQQFYNITCMSDKTSATHLWNPSVDMTNKSNFKKCLLERYLNINASREHFSISRTF